MTVDNVDAETKQMPLTSSMRAFDLFLNVDRSRSAPIGRQIEDQLRAAIRSGKLQARRELPSTRALALDLSVSRGVVVRAYAQLAAEGYLELRQGAAPTVRRPRTSAASNANGRRSRVRYDIGPHVPETVLFPREAWLRSLQSVVMSARNGDLSYGDPRGLEQLRSEVAAYLGRARGIAADPERVIITAGCAHSIHTIVRMLARSGAERIGLENPCDHALHRVVMHGGLSAVGISLDEDGILVGELGRAGVAAVLVSAGHQFPTGALLSRRRQEALVRWASERGGLIIEDEFDAALRPDWTPISAREDLSHDHVVYLGSTGKTLGCAVRLGWALLPKAVANRFAGELAGSVLQLPAIDQLAFADFLRRGEFDRHTRRLRSLFQRRRDELAKALTTAVPHLSVRDAAAGLSMMIELPSVAAEQAAQHELCARGINVETVSRHALPGYAGPAGVLIGVGGLPEGATDHVAKQLSEALLVACPPLHRAA